MDLLISLAIGAAAGWGAGQIMKGGGFGILGNMVVGILGAMLGAFVAGFFGISIGGGAIGSFVLALAGAVLLLFLVGLIKR